MRSAIAAVVTALLVGTCAACGTAPPPPPAQTALSPGQRVLRLEQRTVAVLKRDPFGEVGPQCTGVWVRYDAFLTAAHCTQGLDVGDTVVYATRADVHADKVVGVRVGLLAARDEAHDLALVKDPGAPAHGSAGISEAVVGQNVHTMGHPIGLWWSYSRGEVAAIRFTSFGDGDMWWIQATTPISPGNSGGGLFDDDGNLVGLCAASLRVGQNLNLFVHPKYVKAFVEGVK